LKNIQTRTGKTLEQLHAVIRKSGLTRHGEIRDMLKKELGMGHGDANMLAHLHLKANAPRPPAGGQGDVLDGIYSGAKGDLRPIHDALMVAIGKFGDFEIAPKKAYISLRRKKQFAMIGPASRSRVEVGINMKGVEPTGRLLAQPPGGMCQYKVNVTSAKEVDGELIAWIKRAYENAG